MQLKKRLIKTVLVLLGLSLGLASAGVIALPTTSIQSVVEKLDADIQNLVQKKQIPGCAIAIVHHHKIIFMKGYGVKTVGRPDRINTDTVFQLGSVSKPIAATLASVLEQKGVLKLEDPVNYYLPRFALNSRQSSHHLRIKHILSHSTGVPRAGFNNLIENHTPYSRIVQTLQNTRVRNPIGKRYDYHNAMYSLISDITRSATHQSFNEVLQKNLLTPLNMRHTSATFSSLLQNSNKATPHIRGAEGRLTPAGSYSQGYYAVAPAGGINSSISDMAVFLKAQMGGYPEVLNHRTLMRTQTPQVATQNTLSAVEGPSSLIKNAHYGLGWRIVDFAHHKLIFHGGWVKGFTNFIGFMPEQNLGIVILHNSESRFSARTAVKFFESYLNVPKRYQTGGRQNTKLLFSRKKLIRVKTNTPKIVKKHITPQKKHAAKKLKRR